MARPAQMVVDVRNTSARTLPDVTVAVTSFDYLSDYPNLASRRRPIWVVDEGPGQVPKPPVETVEVDPPGSGTTANYSVWALGPLAPGATRSFVWNVSPVKPGMYRVSYRVYAGLNGRAQAELANGSPPREASRCTSPSARRRPTWTRRPARWSPARTYRRKSRTVSR